MKSICYVNHSIYDYYVTHRINSYPPKLGGFLFGRTFRFFFCFLSLVVTATKKLEHITKAEIRKTCEKNPQRSSTK